MCGSVESNVWIQGVLLRFKGPKKKEQASNNTPNRKCVVRRGWEIWGVS